MTPCLEWEGERSHNGYGRMWTGKIGKSPRTAIHRWVWEEAHGPVPEGMHVMHLCDNPPCYALDHLRLGTAAENIADKVTKGRQARGVTHPAAKLTEDQVREIYASTEPCAELASMYGVNKSSISAIRTGRTWSHITQESRV